MFDLVKTFPTEDSRYDAILKLINGFILCQVICISAGIISVMSMSSRSPGASGIGGLMSIVGTISTIALVVLNIIFLYVYVYSLWKSGSLQYIFKICIGLLVSSIIGLIFFPLAPLLILLAIYVNRKRWEFITHYKRFALYFVVPLVLTFVGLIAGLVMMFLGMSAGHGSGASILGGGSGFIIILFVYFFIPSLTMRYVYKNEKAKGTPYLMTTKLMIVVPVTIIFLILAFSTLIPHHTFSGDSVFDINHDFISHSGVDGTPMDTAGMHASMDSTVAHTGMDTAGLHTSIDTTVAHTGMDTAGLHTSMDSTVAHTGMDTAGMHASMDSTVAHTGMDTTGMHTDLGNMHMSGTGMDDMNPVGHNINTGLDMSGHSDIGNHTDGHFGDTTSHLNAGNIWPDDLHFLQGMPIADVPQIASNPYMMFMHGLQGQVSSQFCSPDGMTQLTVADNTIFDATHVAVGHVNIDQVTHATEYLDNAKNLILKVDNHNNFYSGDHCYLGHQDTSGNNVTMWGTNGKVLYQKSLLNGVVSDAMGHPLGTVKPC